MPIDITALVPIILHRRQHFIKRAAIYDLNWPDISAPIYSKIQPHWNICWLSVKQYKVHFERWTYSYHSVTRNSLSGDMNRQLRITLTISRTRVYKDLHRVFIRVNLHNTEITQHSSNNRCAVSPLEHQSINPSYVLHRLTVIRNSAYYPSGCSVIIPK